MNEYLEQEKKTEKSRSNSNFSSHLAQFKTLYDFNSNSVKTTELLQRDTIYGNTHLSSRDSAS